MAKVSEITELCRFGNIDEAYALAKADYDAAPDDYWAQTALGWALYYKLKDAVANAYFGMVGEIIGESCRVLRRLNDGGSEMLFESVAWQIGKSLKACKADPNMAERFIPPLLSLSFKPGNGYSYLLQEALGVENYESLGSFIHWWNLDNLQPKDFEPYKMAKNRQLMSLAERAYIAYAKALLKNGNKDEIEALIPKMEALMEQHPEMTYPGFFCGRLMMATGATRHDVLAAVVPFVRRKKNDFWAWQLLSEAYADDRRCQLACLLRAVHCRTKEDFLGKVRLALASIYLKEGDPARAKHQLQAVGRHYMAKGWNLPREAVEMAHNPALATVEADATDGLNYMQVTSQLLAEGAEQSVAVVVYVNGKAKRAVLVYGYKKTATVRLSELPFEVELGTVMRLSWLPAANDKISIVSAVSICDDPDANAEEISSLNENYVKTVHGKIRRREGQSFAFIENCYVPQAVAKRHKLEDGDYYYAVAVLNFNKMKNEWTWQCLRPFFKVIEIIDF